MFFLIRISISCLLDICLMFNLMIISFNKACEPFTNSYFESYGLQSSPVCSDS